MAVVKPEDSKMISDSCSLSHLSGLFLSHLCAIVGLVCVTNREAHSLFILVFDYCPGKGAQRRSPCIRKRRRAMHALERKEGREGSKGLVLAEWRCA